MRITATCYIAPPLQGAPVVRLGIFNKSKLVWPRWNVWLTAFLFVGAGLPLSAQSTDPGPYRDRIGFFQLQLREGIANLPTGSSLTGDMIEFIIEDEGHDGYMLDATHLEFSDVLVTNVSNLSNLTTDHANLVGMYFFGNSISMCPALREIDIYRVDHWLYEEFLNTGTTLAPKIALRPIQNHSWAIFEEVEEREEICRRVDYAIMRDGTVMVTGLINNTGPSLTFPHGDLIGQCYNLITVGLTNGKHTRGFTTFDAPGRIKPEIVVSPDAPITSLAVPIVTSAAGFLMDGSFQLSEGQVEARQPETIKALLLAGATKYEFPSWQRTPTLPLDLVYGAGELNIDNSYQILKKGRQSASIEHEVQPTGWDLRYIDPYNLYYFFEVPENPITEFSVILTWYRLVVDGIEGEEFGNLQTHVPDLNLRLYHAAGFTVGALVDESISVPNNVEHIFRKQLPGGRYVLEVSKTTPFPARYALAWKTTSPVIHQPLMSVNRPVNQASFLFNTTYPGIEYTLQATSNLGLGSWSDLETKIGTGYPMSWDVLDLGMGDRRFYRFNYRNMSPDAP